MILGSIESARAMPTRCFMPPESSAGRLCSAPVRPTRSMNFCACARCSVLRPVPPLRRHRIGDVAHDGAPRQQRMALEDDGAVDARAFDRLAVDDDGAFRRRVEAGEDVEHGGLAAAGVADDAGELAALHRQPQVLEHGGGAAAGRREALGDAFDGDELVGSSAPHSGNVTRRVSRARIWSSTMPTSPISRIAVITLVIEKLFHSFQTK